VALSIGPGNAGYRRLLPEGLLVQTNTMRGTGA
jgi:hypothetical protein